jgi:putative drug exporter of the RND superfamily
LAAVSSEGRALTRLLAGLSEVSAGRRSKWLVIGAWVVLALAVTPLQSKLQERAADESDTFLVRGAESTEAKRLIDARFRSGSEMAAVVA